MAFPKKPAGKPAPMPNKTVSRPSGNVPKHTGKNVPTPVQKSGPGYMGC